MKLLPTSSITVEDRQRSKISTEALVDMKRSLAGLSGLINPITVVESGATFRLVAGETRLRAVTEMHEAGETIKHAGKALPSGKIPAIVLSKLDELARVTLELEENTVREDLSWQDKTAALSQLYNLKKAAVEPTATFQEVTNKIAEDAGMDNATRAVEKQVRNALLIEHYKTEPAVAKSRSFHEAHRNAMEAHERKFSAELHRRQKAILAKEVEDTIDLRLGNAIEILQHMDEKQFDVIIADPPYGYNAGEYFPNHTEIKHLYDDSPENTEQLAKVILTEGFRITKPRASVLIFCRPALWQFLFDFSKRMAWTPWHNPILWDKGVGGSAPWGRLGPKRRYEMLFWAVKGKRGLTKQFDDIITGFGRDRSREHAAEKPLALMEFLVEHLTDPGETILDPTMGSGSTILAAKRLNRRACGIELIETYYDMAVNRLAEKDEEVQEELAL